MISLPYFPPDNAVKVLKRVIKQVKSRTGLTYPEMAETIGVGIQTIYGIIWDRVRTVHDATWEKFKEGYEGIMSAPINKMPSNPGKILRNLREAAGISQDGLAVYSGVSKVHISRVERGLNNVSPKLWANWMEILSEYINE